MTAARRFAWRHPHWWAIALCGSAWGWVVARWWSSGHTHGLALLDWTLMVGAMMVPLVFTHLRVVAARSLWRRRQRAMAGFLCGYVALSLLAGIVVIVLVGAADIVASHLGSPALVATGVVLAAAWQVTPVKRRALTACHRTVPLAPRGWRAHGDCVRYGWIVGCHCLVSCAGLMVACVLAGHSLPVMAVAAIVAWRERVGIRPNAWRPTALLAMVIATTRRGAHVAAGA
jgi:hypothetical protein